jgi:hypothetical protein
MFAFFMTLIIVPSMYIIAERLRRPMRRMFGGKWVSFLGIPPLTILLIVLIIVVMIKHLIVVARRRRKLAASHATVNESFIGSWF